MALALSRNSGESVVFNNKNDGTSLMATVLQRKEHKILVKLTVGTHSAVRELGVGEKVEFFDGDFFVDARPREGKIQYRFICDFPKCVNIVRKELLK